MARTNTKRADAEQAAIIERQFQALEHRKNGLSYREIGTRLGVSHVQARNDVQSALSELAKLNLDSADDLRQIELERLDRAIAGMMHWIDAGSPNHIMALNRCIDTRAKLLGLYMPERHEVLTWEDRAIADIRAGNISYRALAEEFDESLATRLFAAAGVPVSSG